MSNLTTEQIEGMVAARNLEPGEPMFVVQAAWNDIEEWLIENRPVVRVETLPDGTEFKVQEPWDWEADSDTIVLLGHPVYVEGWIAAPSKEERDNFVDEAMVLGNGAGVRVTHEHPGDGTVQAHF